MITGSIRWVHDNKGFGYITPTYGDIDIFFHRSAIKYEGFSSLRKGDKVTYDIDQKDPEGPCAINVIKQ